MSDSVSAAMAVSNSQRGGGVYIRPLVVRSFFSIHSSSVLYSSALIDLLRILIIQHLTMALRYNPSVSPSDVQGPDPLTDNWTYDSAIDLFSWNTLLPDPFTFDLPDYLDLPDPIAGFAVPGDASESASVCPYLMSL